jgi:hypothetical protein
MRAGRKQQVINKIDNLKIQLHYNRYIIRLEKLITA